MRVYPQAGGGPDSSLAAHLLGFVNRDGTGQYGVEQAYQDSLAGSPRVVIAERDANGRSLLDQATVVDPGAPGQDVRLTIDAGLQLAVEQELLAAWVADKAKSVSAVVMDPYTGEVYAEATVSRVRREPLPPDRRHGSRALHRPRRRRTSTSRLGVQDDDRDGRARDRLGQPLDEDQRRRHAPSRQGQDQGR